MKIVVKDFYADWCGPCRMQKPVIHELEEEMKDVKFEKINIDENQDKASEAGVMSIPTIIIEADGKEVNRFVGFTSKEQLEKSIENAKSKK
ncbi:MAG: thioredoxin [Candidatus Nanoarchaeia archaeon]|nr:thioredoxin [Candidatus Nanoarchaeia archaeon]